MQRPERPTTNRNFNQQIKDLKFDKYKSLLELYKTRHKSSALIENFSNLDKMRINTINDNFSSLDKDAKKEFFDLAETNRFVLATIANHPATTNDEINKLLYLPSMTVEIVTLIAQRPDLDKRNCQAICDILGPTIHDLYIDRWFHSFSRENPFCEGINGLFLKSQESCKEMGYFPLIFSTDKKAIQEYCNSYELSEEEITMICNNKYIDSNFKNKIFDMGANFGEIYYKTEHMKNTVSQSAYDTVYNFEANDNIEKEIQENARKELLNQVMQKDITEFMEEKIAEKIVSLINAKECKFDDKEILRFLYMDTKCQKTLESYLKIKRYNEHVFDLAVSISRNNICPEKICDTIAEMHIRLLDNKDTLIPNEENDIVRELGYLVENKTLSFNNLYDIYELGYLSLIEKMVKSSHTLDAILHHIMLDEDKTSIKVFKEMAMLNLKLRENGLPANIASIIVSEIENPSFFENCLYSETEYNQIKEAFDEFLKSERLLSDECIAVLSAIKDGKDKFVKLSKSGLFDISRDCDSIKNARYTVKPDLTQLHSIKNTPEQIAEKLMSFETTASIDVYKRQILDALADDLDKNIHIYKSLFAPHTCEEQINLYSVIDVYNDMYENFKEGLKIAKSNIRKKEKKTEREEENTKEIETEKET